MVELAGDHLERVGGQNGEQLVVGEPEAVAQDRCRRGAQKSWFSE